MARPYVPKVPRVPGAAGPYRPKVPSVPGAYPKPHQPYVPTIPPVAGAYPNQPPAPGSLTPPTFTFDPAQAAGALRAKHEEENKLAEIGTHQHFAETDLHTALGNIVTENKRKRQDYAREFGRGNEKIGNQEADVNRSTANQEADTRSGAVNREADLNRSAGRQQEDFTTRLADISKQFGELGHRQSEAQNASGTLDEGTTAAAAAARARNQVASEAPIHTGEARNKEDLYTALQRLGTSRDTSLQRLGEGHATDLERLGTARTQLGEDHRTSENQLVQDREFNRKKVHTAAGRELFELGREQQQALVAGTTAQQSALEAEIYEAKENHPAAFAAWAKENPSLVPEGVNVPGAKPGEPKPKPPPLRPNPLSTPPKKKGRR